MTYASHRLCIKMMKGGVDKGGPTGGRKPCGKKTLSLTDTTHQTDIRSTALSQTEKISSDLGS